LDGSFVELGGKTFLNEWGSSLSVTNGTRGGTFAVAGFGRIGGITAAGDDVYLTTDTGVWRSDGTPAGTVQVLPMYNNVDGMAAAGSFAEMGGSVYFFAGVRGGSSGLWKTDGSPGGTTPVAPVASVRALAAAGDTLYFLGPDPDGSGRELWKSDGTQAGTVVVKNIDPRFGGVSPATEGRALATLGKKAFFVAQEQPGP
jgi:ELWxxDGT repeat protein